MKLAKFAESDNAKKISKVLLQKGRVIGLLFFCLGIGIYCLFPVEGYHRKKFFDENALLTGLVKREFRGSGLLADLQSQHVKHKNSSQQLHVWIQNTLIEYGLEVYTHNYTAGHIVLQQQDDQSDIHGTNVYGILRAGRSSSVEAIVLTAPDKLDDGSDSVGIVVLLSLAKFFSSKNYWAKDIIFLVTSEGLTGMQSWLNAYMGTHTSAIYPEPLVGRSGAIQAVVNIEIGHGNIDYINIIPEGVNAILPNLDLVFVASTLCEMEQLPITYHINWNSPGFFKPKTEYFKSMMTSLAVLFHHGTGLPITNHAPFLYHRIDSVTLRGIHGNNTDKTLYQLKELARALEGIFRSINNLLERLHHSEFFYINMSRNTFISIGQYSPFFVLLLSPILIESLRQWILCKQEETNDSSEKTFYEKMGIPPQLSVSLVPLFIMIMWSLTSGCVLYYTPLLLQYCNISLTPHLLLSSLLTIWLLFYVSTVYFRLTMTKSSYNMSCSIVLLLITVLLYSLALMHFSFSFLLSILLSIPLSLSTSYHICSRILMILFSPPLLVFYLCFNYTLLFSTTTTDTSLYDQFSSSLELLLSGVQLSYSYHYTSNAWLYPLLCMVLCPVWLLCWNLGLITIKVKDHHIRKDHHIPKEHHVHND